ncbi:MAG TPA: 3-hydroxyacyl-CoA dehydrogenase family protein [Chitinophagaceae bacterium]
MKIAVVCNKALQEDFLFKKMNNETAIVFVGRPEDIPGDATVVFDLLFENKTERIALLRQYLPRPVIVNAVTATLAEIGEPFIRINAWPGFLRHEILEIAASPAQHERVQTIFTRLGWKYRLVADIAGLVSARVIAMIINEAWFTYGEGISTREEIDIAMKSGTNYPLGPFEWSEKIGVSNICQLLRGMCATDSRYEIAPALKEACEAAAVTV